MSSYYHRDPKYRKVPVYIEQGLQKIQICMQEFQQQYKNMIGQMSLKDQLERSLQCYNGVWFLRHGWKDAIQTGVKIESEDLAILLKNVLLWHWRHYADDEPGVDILFHYYNSVEECLTLRLKIPELGIDNLADIHDIESKNVMFLLQKLSTTERKKARGLLGVQNTDVKKQRGESARVRFTQLAKEFT